MHAVSGSIAEIYRFAIPIGVLAVILSLTLPEIKLRTSLHPVADEIPMSNADPLL
jgi:FlaG/FlaF family flagellin (archaellin)